MKTIISILAIIILCPLAIAQTTSMTSTKATATLSATCSINAQSLSFGAIILPLTSQSASSQMTVLCSKEAPYTIEMSYGGIYGADANAGSNYWQSGGGTCYVDSIGYPIVNLYEYQTGKLLQGYVCGNNVLPGTTAVGTGGATKYYTGPVPGQTFSYGVMKGSAKGDSVAYSIAVPNEPSKIWNTGQGSYTDSGTGKTQTISISAKLIPANSGGLYPAPDLYMDTVTTKITY